MNYFKLLTVIYLKDGRAVTKDCREVMLNGDPVEAAVMFANRGADELLIMDLADDDREHELNINTARSIADNIDIPFIMGGHIKRFEDVKKYIYCGAKMAAIDPAEKTGAEILKEAADRFGAGRVCVFGRERAGVQDVKSLAYDCISSEEDIAGLYGNDWVYGIASSDFTVGQDLMELKYRLREDGINTQIYDAKYDFSEFKTGADGLIPVVVQDYKTNDVLMLAYMNREAYEATVRTGRMTYFSRSRGELWEKGYTSGHYQYLKEFVLDCDMDTILAKVFQVGAACHTGSRSCFFNTDIKKEYDNTNPLKVFVDVYDVIRDRKDNPKEGSYTNYLFDKGLDKILKKIGEEASEIIIAAKNPESGEIKYEISDFLYHVMVLMVQKDITWSDITKELSRR